MERDDVAHKGEKLAGLEVDLSACFRQNILTLNLKRSSWLNIHCL